jgi:glutamyl-tRNA synthetase
LDELISAFSLERINKAGAKFDVNKAKWFNEQYLKQEDVSSLATQYLPDLSKKEAESFVHLFLDRITFPQELSEKVKEFKELPTTYEEAVMLNKWNEESQKGLQVLMSTLPELESWDADSIKSFIQVKLDEAGIKMGKVMQMLRVALSGNGAGPDLMISMELWGKEQVLLRLGIAMETFNKR